MNTFIFDIDGTLLDNVEAYLYGLQKTLRRHGREVPIHELTWTNGRAGVDSLAELGFSAAEIPEVHEQWREDSKEFLTDIAWFPGMQHALNQLKQTYKLGLVTSKDKTQFIEEDKKFHFSPYFDAIVVAGEAKRNKPFGDPITLARERLGSEPASTIYIGDTPTDAQAAADAKVAFALAGWTTPPSNEVMPRVAVLQQTSDLLTLPTLA